MDSTQVYDVTPLLPALTQNIWVYLGILLIQIIFLFKRQWASLINVLIAKLRTKQTRVNHKTETQITPPLKSSEKAIKVVTYLDLHSYNDRFTLKLDQSSEVRSRFAIFRLTSYGDISQLMMQLSTHQVELLSTTVIFNVEHNDILMFYVRYYGLKFTIDNNEDKTQSVLFTD